MDLRYTHEIGVEEYNSLRLSVGWGTICETQAQQVLTHSAYLISCYDKNKAVGFARMIWNHDYIAFLADVMVLPDYQGMGIGHTMVEHCLSYMKSQVQENWRMKIVLTASQGKEDFYRKFGFCERPNSKCGAGMDLWLA